MITKDNILKASPSDKLKSKDLLAKIKNKPIFEEKIEATKALFKEVKVAQ